MPDWQTSELVAYNLDSMTEDGTALEMLQPVAEFLERRRLFEVKFHSLASQSVGQLVAAENQKRLVRQLVGDSSVQNMGG